MSSDTAATKQELQLHLSGAALAIPLLHAAKYPTSTVLGVFLAPKESPSNTADLALPLIHREPNLTPMTELAMEHVVVYAARTERKVVGVYVSAGTGKGVRAVGGGGGVGGVGRMAERFLEYVRRFFPAGAGAGASTSTGPGDEVWGVFVSLDMSSTTLDAGWPYTYTVISSSTPTPLPTLDVSKVLPLIRRDKLHRGLTDFDDHLDDANADWTNAALLPDLSRRLV